MRFSLQRLMIAVGIATCALSAFAVLYWPLAVLAVAVANTAVAITSWIRKRFALGYLTFGTCCLMLATLYFTDWGVSTLKGVVRPSWACAIAATIAQLTAVAVWLFDEPPERSETRGRDLPPH